MAVNSDPFAGVQFSLVGTGIAVANINGQTYLRLDTDPAHASRTAPKLQPDGTVKPGATDMVASTGPWVSIPGVAKHPDHGGDFRIQLNAGYRIPKANRG